jgi:hypothetical protein
VRRIFNLAALALTVVLAINGLCRAQSDLSAFQPIGRMIAVDGHQVHLCCTGAAAPTVILEGGRAVGSLIWAWSRGMSAGRHASGPMTGPVMVGAIPPIFPWMLHTPASNFMQF